MEFIYFITQNKYSKKWVNRKQKPQPPIWTRLKRKHLGGQLSVDLSDSFWEEEVAYGLYRVVANLQTLILVNQRLLLKLPSLNLSLNRYCFYRALPADFSSYSEQSNRISELNNSFSSRLQWLLFSNLS